MFEGVAFSQLGPWGLVSVFVMLVFLGGLVPRWIHNQRVDDKDRLIDRLTAALDKRDEQFDILIKQGEAVVKLLEDLKRASDKSVESRHTT